MTQPPRTTPSWWLVAGGAAATAGAAYCLLRRGGAAGTEAADETDFAGFLSDPERLAAAQARPSAAVAGAAAAKPRGGDPTGFDAFLVAAPAAGGGGGGGDPTGFDAFLRAPATAGAAGASAAAAGAAAEGEQPPPPGRAAVAVVYGTEHGFAREIAEKLVVQLKAGDGFWPRLINMADHPEGYDLSAEQAALLVCSTQGDGVPPTEAREFCDWLTAGKAGPLPDLHYSVLALGDTAYPHFCRCGRTLDAALAAAGARALAPRVDVDKEDWAAIDGWLGGVTGALPGLGLRSISETGVPGAGAAAGPAAAAAAAMRHSKARPYLAKVVALESLCAVADKMADKDTVRVEFDLGDSGLEYLPGDALGIYPTNAPEAVAELLQVLGADGAAMVPVPAWHYAEPEGWAKAVPAPGGKQGLVMPLEAALARCYDLRVPKGEALLKALLGALPATNGGGKPDGAAVSVAAFANGTAAAPGGGADVGSDGGAPDDGGDDTSVGADPDAKPRGGASDTAATDLAARARALLADKAALDAYLAPRHVVDVLRDFGAATARQLGEHGVLPALRQLQPRLYSISSSPAEAPPGCSRVQATIAVVRYESLGADRHGVCSTFVAERMLGAGVDAAGAAAAPVFISKNPDFRLPADPATPVIMVGPGTGLAPFRAFVVDRLIAAGADPRAIGGGADGADGSGGSGSTDSNQPQQQQQQQQNGGACAGVGPMVLFFGCRRRGQDYLYGADLERWARAGAIELHTAFSRERGQPKRYVQQRLAEAAARVWELLEAGAHFYICGDASAMAPAVEAELLRIIAARVEGGEAGAEAYFDRLVAAGRFERDVWFG